jgi:putative glutathione S-transferase
MAKKPAENQVGYKHLEKGDGKFNRQISSFRSWISSEPGAEFPPEKDRYVSSQHDPAAWGGSEIYCIDFRQVLYINLGCPWASRANLVRTLKGLEDVIHMVVMDWELYPEGWFVPFPLLSFLLYSL